MIRVGGGGGGLCGWELSAIEGGEKHPLQGQPPQPTAGRGAEDGIGCSTPALPRTGQQEERSGRKKNSKNQCDFATEGKLKLTGEAFFEEKQERPQTPSLPPFLSLWVATQSGLQICLIYFAWHTILFSDFNNLFTRSPRSF